jgi:hypothetical protein
MPKMFEKEDLESITSDEQHERDSMIDDNNDITLEKPNFRPRWGRPMRRSGYINYAALFLVLLVTGIGIFVLSTRSPTFSSTLLSGRENLLRPEDFLSDSQSHKTLQVATKTDPIAVSLVTQEFQPDTSLWRFDEVGDEAWLQRIQPGELRQPHTSKTTVIVVDPQ